MNLCHAFVHSGCLLVRSRVSFIRKVVYQQLLRLNLENSSCAASANVHAESEIPLGGVCVYKKRGEHESDQSISVSIKVIIIGVARRRSDTLVYLSKNIFCHKRKCKQFKMKEYLVYSCLVSENYYFKTIEKTLIQAKWKWQSEENTRFRIFSIKIHFLSISLYWWGSLEIKFSIELSQNRFFSSRESIFCGFAIFTMQFHLHMCSLRLGSESIFITSFHKRYTLLLQSSCSTKNCVQNISCLNGSSDVFPALEVSTILN